MPSVSSDWRINSLTVRSSRSAWTSCQYVCSVLSSVSSTVLRKSSRLTRWLFRLIVIRAWLTAMPKFCSSGWFRVSDRSSS